MPVHTGEKKFECENCTQRFTQSSSLYKHLKKANCVKWIVSNNNANKIKSASTIKDLIKLL